MPTSIPYVLRADSAPDGLTPAHRDFVLAKALAQVVIQWDIPEPPSSTAPGTLPAYVTQGTHTEPDEARTRPRPTGAGSCSTSSSELSPSPDGLSPSPDGLVPSPDGLVPSPDGLVPSPDGPGPSPDRAGPSPSHATSDRPAVVQSPPATPLASILHCIALQCAHADQNAAPSLSSSSSHSAIPSDPGKDLDYSSAVTMSDSDRDSCLAILPGAIEAMPLGRWRDVRNPSAVPRLVHLLLDGAMRLSRNVATALSGRQGQGQDRDRDRDERGEKAEGRGGSIVPSDDRDSASKPPPREQGAERAATATARRLFLVAAL